MKTKPAPAQLLAIIDVQDIKAIRDDLKEVKQALRNIKVTAPAPEYMTSDEFMKQAKISRWKFDMLISNGLLKFRKIGRKFYIPSTEVSRYFDGEMVLIDK